MCGCAKVKEWDLSSHTWGEKKENENIFPGQGLFTVIRIKGLGLMGKMCLQVGSFPVVFYFGPV